MPGKKHLRGVGNKEQRQYEHIKENAEKSGRYGGECPNCGKERAEWAHPEGYTKGKLTYCCDGCIDSVEFWD